MARRQALRLATEAAVADEAGQIDKAFDKGPAHVAVTLRLVDLADKAATCKLASSFWHRSRRQRTLRM